MQRGSRRVGWTVADQGLSSLTNFALSLLIARSVDSEQFGAFAIALSGYLVVLGISRALSTDILCIRYSAAAAGEWRQAAAAATGVATVVGLGAIPVAVGISACVGDDLRSALLALAIVLPMLLLQDAWRFVFFAHGRPVHAAANDGVWAVALGVAFALLHLVGASAAWMWILGWGGSAAVAALVGLAQARVRPRVAAVRPWLRQHRDLSPSLLGEFAVMSGVGQAVAFVVGAVAGLAQVGALRGAQVALGPVNVVIMSAGAVAVPEGARLWMRSPRALVRGMLAVAAVAAVLTLAWAVVAWRLPAAVGERLLGPTWEAAHEVIPALGLLATTSAVAQGAGAGLRVLERPDRSLRIRALAAPLLLVGGAAGALLDGARGAVLGIALPTMLATVASWLAFVDAAAVPTQVEPGREAVTGPDTPLAP